MKMWKERYAKPQEPLPLPRSPSPKPVSREELQQDADEKTSTNELPGLSENEVESREEYDVKKEAIESKNKFENAELESVLGDRKEIEVVSAEEKNAEPGKADPCNDIQVKETTTPFADAKGEETKDGEFEDNDDAFMRHRSWKKLKDNGEEKSGGIDDKDIDAYLERRRARMTSSAEKRSQSHRRK